MKINYQEIQEIQISNFIKTHNRGPSLLLHSCCAPCSSYVLELLSSFFDITIYFYNPNIHPKDEYLRRLNELRLFLKENETLSKIKLIYDEYDPSIYFTETLTTGNSELKFEKERGIRCYHCYFFRLKKTFEYAFKNNYDFFTTTLSISPHKDAEKINNIGKQLIESLNNNNNADNEINNNSKYSINNYDRKVDYLYADFKKNNGYLRSLELSKQYNLYRQDYCGCIFSKMQKNERQKNGNTKNI